MKLESKRGIRVAAAVAVGALSLGTLSACAPAADSNVFTVWWYEKDTAMATTWAAALDAFKTAHPDVTVKFELKTWDQIQKSGNAILDSDKAPDLAEWNKGNATAGSASQAGLLTNLDDYAKEYGWDTMLPQSVLAYGEYTDGIMGSGSLYGVPTYGEYASWFYNVDAFKAAGITSPPETMAELEADLATLKAAGQTQCIGAKEYQNVHLAYGLALSQADQEFVNNFQAFAGPVDWTKEWTYAANTISDWIGKGYFDPNASGIGADDAVAAFQAGSCPLIYGGTWLDEGMQKNSVSFEWNKFLMPGGLSVGSAGNLLVIPERSKHKDWAAEFINMILTPEYQNMLGNNGGLPLLADEAALTNPLTVKTYAQFKKILDNDALGMYPDWPVPGYFDIQLAAGQKLFSDSDAAAYVKTLQDFYDQNKP